MKKLLVIIAVMLCVVAVFMMSDSRVYRDGEFKWCDNDDSMMCDMDENVITGTVEHKNESGNGLAWRAKIHDGYMNGVATEYNDSGIMVTHARYTNGRLDGVEKRFYDDGKLWSVTHYKNGIQHGKRTFYSPSGNIQEVKNFENGISNGITRGYYADGALEVEMNFANGKLDGPYQHYYPNGSPRLKLYYADNVIDGTAYWYNRNGSLHADAIFENGKIVSGHKYDEKGDSFDMTDEDMSEYGGKIR